MAIGYDSEQPGESSVIVELHLADATLCGLQRPTKTHLEDEEGVRLPREVG